MAIKRCILVDRTNKQPIYSAQIFEYDDSIQSSPAGLLGGPGQHDWFWVDVTGKTDAEAKALIGKSHTLKGGETLPAKDAAADAGKNALVSYGSFA